MEEFAVSPSDLVFEGNTQGVIQSVTHSCSIDYVLQLRERIRSCLEIVNANEKIAKKQSKCWYDRNPKPVSYKEGELVLPPLIGKPLQAKFFGPYVIEKRIGEVDYVVRTPDRPTRKSKRVVHVNLLKKYIARVTDTPSPIAIVTVSQFSTLHALK